MIPHARHWMGEEDIEAVVEVFGSDWLHSRGIELAQEVRAPAMPFDATAGAVLPQGGRLVFADVPPATEAVIAPFGRVVLA